MSTIEVILKALQANAQDKKRVLDDSYKEKSVWLETEFELIRKLIHQNPRDNCLKAESVSSKSDEPSSSSSSIRRDSSLDGKKRKSPETVDSIKQSPLQKRASVDVDDLISKAGLPPDLNKLTKEQLLNELKKLGCHSFSQKMLKKELVDGLRDAMVADHNSKTKNTVQANNPQFSAPPPANEEKTDVASGDTADSGTSSSADMILSTPSKTGSVRRGSQLQMADFRTIVAQAASTALQSAAPGIESEFLARQNRHRESVARKSMVGASDLPAASEVPIAASDTSKTSACAVPACVSPPKECMDDIASVSVIQKDCIYPEDGVWMEVSSPARSNTSDADVPKSAVKGDLEKVSTEYDEKVLPDEEHRTVAAAMDSAELDEANRVRSESDASFVSCLSAASAPKASIASKEPVSKPIASSGGVPNLHKNGLSVVQKPVSADVKSQSSTSSNYGKPMVQPQKAKMSAQHSSTSTNSNNSSSASNASTGTQSTTSFKKKDVIVDVKQGTRPTGSTTISNSSGTASSSAVSAPAKKGIFGFLTNKKPTASNSTPVASAGVLSTISGAAAPQPAMVDAIIKDGKVDREVAAPIAAKAFDTSADPAISLSGTFSAPVKQPASTAAPLKDAFASKSLLSSIVNNYNNAIQAGNSAPAHHAPSTSILRDITAATSGPAAANKSVASVPTTTPAKTTSVVETATEYVIEDRNSSDESGTDGEEEDAEAAKKKQQSVPEWARGPKLKEALERQYGMHGQVPMDPDLIFPEVTTCSLEEIFGLREGKNNKKYSARSSSAHWEADQMTLVEKRVYRKHMGYDRPTQAGNHL